MVALIEFRPAWWASVMDGCHRPPKDSLTVSNFFYDEESPARDAVSPQKTGVLSEQVWTQRRSCLLLNALNEFPIATTTVGSRCDPLSSRK